jgi:DNA-directed RNA polymerase specialized sigma24 family protein
LGISGFQPGDSAPYQSRCGIRVRPQKWTLNQEALDTFLARLDPDRDCAAQHYEQVRNKLATFFRCNECSDAEGLVDETIDRVVRRLGEVVIHDLMPFIRGVARRVASEAHQMRIRLVPLDEVSERFQSDTDSGDRGYADKRHGCLEKCLGQLSRQERDLAVEFYKQEKAEKIENKKRMAEAMGITTGTLRVRAYRVRKQLEGCITKCMAVSIP